MEIKQIIYNTQKYLELIFMASSVWRCCKCKEEMYDNENYCNYCQHSRCYSCKNLEV